jgi:pimeloyl-ACP methyl ester carboxylesterase
VDPDLGDRFPAPTCPRSTCPCWCSKGDADQVLPIDKTGKQLPGLINDVQLVVIEGGPHAIPWTHAARSTRPCWTSSAADIP